MDPCSQTTRFLHASFDALCGALEVASAIQHLVLECLTDVHMRFTIYYNFFPESLVYVLV